MTLSVGLFVRMLLISTLVVPVLYANNPAVGRCLRAAQVLDKVMRIPERAIPQELMGRSQCIAIIPGVKKAGFGFGGRYGKGVMSCRSEDESGWTGPLAVKLEGGSFGLQIGGSSTDFVLLIFNKHGVQRLLKSKFTLGGDAAVAGGPLGRSAQAQTDAQLRAEILSYSRSRGLFAGVSLEGATLRPGHKANEKIYGRQVDPKQVLAAQVAAPSSVQPFIDALNRYSSSKHR